MKLLALCVLQIFTLNLSSILSVLLIIYIPNDVIFDEYDLIVHNSCSNFKAVILCFKFGSDYHIEW